MVRSSLQYKWTALNLITSREVLPTDASVSCSAKRVGGHITEIPLQDSNTGYIAWHLLPFGGHPWQRSTANDSEDEDYDPECEFLSHNDDEPAVFKRGKTGKITRFQLDWLGRHKARGYINVGSDDTPLRLLRQFKLGTQEENIDGSVVDRLLPFHCLNINSKHEVHTQPNGSFGSASRIRCRSACGGPASAHLPRPNHGLGGPRSCRIPAKFPAPRRGDGHEQWGRERCRERCQMDQGTHQRPEV